MTRPSLEVWVPREGRAGERPRSLSRTTLQWTSAETCRRGEGAPPSPPVRKEPQPPTPRTHQLRSVQRGQRVCWARNCSASPAPKGSSPGDSGISGICCTPGSCPSWKGGPPKQAAPAGSLRSKGNSATSRRERWTNPVGERGPVQGEYTWGRTTQGEQQPAGNDWRVRGSRGSAGW